MKIYYYSRTERSQAIAKQLGERYNCQVCAITDVLVEGKKAPFLKCGAMASGEKTTEITYDAPDADEQMVLVFPVWAGKFPPAIRTFLQLVQREKIIAVPTSLGTKLKDRNGFVAVVDLVGKVIEPPDVSELIQS